MDFADRHAKDRPGEPCGASEETGCDNAEFAKVDEEAEEKTRQPLAHASGSVIFRAGSGRRSLST